MRLELLSPARRFTSARNVRKGRIGCACLRSTVCLRRLALAASFSRPPDQEAGPRHERGLPRLSAEPGRLAALVAGPAETASSGPIVLCCCPGAEASYEAAELPAGGWAVKVRCAYETGDKYTRMVPWRPFPTESECLDFAVAQARNHFTQDLHGAAADQVKRRAVCWPLWAA